MYYIINIFGDVDVLLQSSVCRPPKNRIKSTTMIFFHNYGMVVIIFSNFARFTIQSTSLVVNQ